MRQRLLGGIAPRAFLRRYWQKRPLLVRGALPEYRGALDLRALAALAARADVESRIVERRGARWKVKDGPFRQGVSLGRTHATLLVSGVNLHLPAAERLLRRFAFLPQARLDDVMVSYAAPGGGVGPHADSYDVFLLQGSGRRVWRLEPPRAFRTAAGSPLRQIAGFEPGEEYLVEPGDLLYLPPGWGHDGVALEPGFTWSIGFRAPAGAELASAFLDWLHERGLPEAAYRDPGTRPTRYSGRIPQSMIHFSRAVIDRIRWRPGDVVRFLGEYLTAPKPHVVFPAVRRAPPIGKSPLRLDPKTQLLYSGTTFFINGESLVLARREARVMRALADHRRVAGRALARAGLTALAREWYCKGYLVLEKRQ